MFLNIFDTAVESHLFIVFAIFIALFLIFDLGLFHRTPGKISTKSALYQSIFWVAVSVAFGFVIYMYEGGDKSAEFFSAYLTEKALSVDNIFVIILIFNYFRVKEEYYHKILFWGILGAIVFRAIFIFLGGLLIDQFHWILYIFGAFLIYTGFKLFFQKQKDKLDPENSFVRFVRRFVVVSKSDFGGKIFIRRNGRLLFTPLFIVILLIESTDLMFAVDSIPAAFAITRDEFIIYTSNIFAIMGLRSMFFLLAGVLYKFKYLQHGLSLVLIFIGIKMLLEVFDLHLSIYVSFGIIAVTLTASLIYSLLVTRNEKMKAKKESKEFQNA